MQEAQFTEEEMNVLLTGEGQLYGKVPKTGMLETEKWCDLLTLTGAAVQSMLCCVLVLLVLRLLWLGSSCVGATPPPPAGSVRPMTFRVLGIVAVCFVFRFSCFSLAILSGHHQISR